MNNSVFITIDVDSMNQFFAGDSDCGTISVPYDADPFSKIEANQEIKKTADAFIIRFLKDESYQFNIQSLNRPYQYLYFKFSQLCDESGYVPWESIFENLSATNHFVNEKFELVIPANEFSFTVGNPAQKNNLSYSVSFSYTDQIGITKWGSLDPLVDIKNDE